VFLSNVCDETEICFKASCQTVFDLNFINNMSIFVHSNCQIVGDVAVNHASWSKSAQILALSTYSIDEHDKETNKVLFVNNEVFILACDFCISHIFKGRIDSSVRN
jgi:hypothetical protein